MSYLKVTLVGHIGKAEINTSDKTKARYLRVSVAHNDKELSDEGPMWFSCILTGKVIENEERILNTLTTGRQVLVEGRLRTKGYKKGEGKLGVNHTLLLDSLPRVLDSRPGNNQAK